MVNVKLNIGPYSELEQERMNDVDAGYIDVFDMDIMLIIILLNHKDADVLLNALAERGLICFENTTILPGDVVAWYERPGSREQSRYFVVKLISQTSGQLE